MQLTLDNHHFTVIHKTNKKIKRISVALENQDEIILRTPLKFKSHLIKEIIYGYKDWIINSKRKLPKKESIDFSANGYIPYLGKRYPLYLVVDENIKNIKFELVQDHFKVYCSKSIDNYEQFLEGLKTFYKYNAKNIIDPIFQRWSHITKLYPNKISYRDNKTRWGSCSSQDNISINYKLLQFDIAAIEYVVLHELCHIKHKNHSKQFWNLLSDFMGDYKQKEKLLNFKLF